MQKNLSLPKLPFPPKDLSFPRKDSVIPAKAGIQASYRLVIDVYITYHTKKNFLATSAEGGIQTYENRQR